MQLKKIYHISLNFTLSFGNQRKNFQVQNMGLGDIIRYVLWPVFAPIKLIISQLNAKLLDQSRRLTLSSDGLSESPRLMIEPPSNEQEIAVESDATNEVILPEMDDLKGSVEESDASSFHEYPSISIDDSHNVGCEEGVLHTIDVHLRYQLDQFGNTLTGLTENQNVTVILSLCMLIFLSGIIFKLVLKIPIVNQGEKSPNEYSFVIDSNDVNESIELEKNKIIQEQKEPSQITRAGILQPIDINSKESVSHEAKEIAKERIVLADWKNTEFELNENINDEPLIQSFDKDFTEENKENIEEVPTKITINPGTLINSSKAQIIETLSKDEWPDLNLNLNDILPTVKKISDEEIDTDMEDANRTLEEELQNSVVENDEAPTDLDNLIKNYNESIQYGENHNYHAGSFEIHDSSNSTEPNSKEHLEDTNLPESNDSLTENNISKQTSTESQDFWIADSQKDSSISPEKREILRLDTNKLLYDTENLNFEVSPTKSEYLMESDSCLSPLTKIEGSPLNRRDSHHRATKSLSQDIYISKLEGKHSRASSCDTLLSRSHESSSEISYKPSGKKRKRHSRIRIARRPTSQLREDSPIDKYHCVYDLDPNLETLLNFDNETDPLQYFQNLGFEFSLAISEAEHTLIVMSLKEAADLQNEEEMKDMVQTEIKSLLIDPSEERSQFTLLKLRYVISKKFVGENPRIINLIEMYKSTVGDLFLTLTNAISISDSKTAKLIILLICEFLYFYSAKYLSREEYVTVIKSLIETHCNHRAISKFTTQPLIIALSASSINTIPKIFTDLLNSVKNEGLGLKKKFKVIFESIKCYICFNKQKIVSELTINPNENKNSTCIYKLMKLFVTYIPITINLMELTKIPRIPVQKSKHVESQIPIFPNELLIELVSFYKVVNKLILENEEIPSAIQFEFLNSFFSRAYYHLKIHVQSESEDFPPPAISNIESK